ncbi:Alkaline phosphatase synthesis transcriptional regulatory protein PhoP [Anaerohalosphaera lusitana]|uniref:Alkaline phosphatase synthesis transcriptional regulatory protein PhoP n=1 Tax=Anaerohalosphaera lusitana TaxID=1936003 RepID=A0A1U9NPI5_9BACT|nr:response regulator [Anaerohalosphaera lusitana]AQT69520.1 Alkaline phosphatase synthesis transcriptional regulatory protein PhoP [Anaerohalosphaera lusitana]
MANERILIVEDEEDVLELESYNLKKNGYNVEAATTGEQALEKALNHTFDLVLLDIMLPTVDGLEVCKILKTNPQTAEVPIIMLTAKGEESDIVAGLELGADDYITKPFSPRVLMARVKAVLRRKRKPTPEESETVRRGPIEIHPNRHMVTVEGQNVDLTSTEFSLLHLLARKPGWVFTRYKIVDAIHGTDHAVTDRSVDVQVVGLRKKLGSAGKLIETVRGVGYRFKDLSAEQDIL